MKKLLFESEVCGRCAGTGKHSFNLRDGSMCYGCSGYGTRLTKRGAEAQRYFRELSTKTVAELVPGDIVRAKGLTNGGDCYSYQAAVVEVIIDDPNGPKCISNGIEHIYTTVRMKSEKFGESVLHTFPTHKKEVLGGNRSERIQKALAYQETLTKAGKPRKR